MDQLLSEIRGCTTCVPHLELGPNPVISAHPKSKVVIIGQAPGQVVHRTGIPWDDKSGENLRSWMGISTEAFYDEKKIALIPMGFCYPGKGKSGDLPPRKECAPLWHRLLLAQLQEVKLTLLIGQYSQKYYLKEHLKKNLTETVRHFREYLPVHFVLPPPVSPQQHLETKKPLV